MTRIEQGEHGDPRLSILRRLARAFHVSTADLVHKLDGEASHVLDRRTRTPHRVREGAEAPSRRARGTPEDGTALGRRMCDHCDKAASSQHAVAVAAGVSDSLISRSERGSRYDPRLSTLRGSRGC
jgi:transcriptional regulator with XRE-family HTH domain